MKLVVFGLSISSSWGNGHATTYRGLLGALAGQGWEITFFEREEEWYRSNRDLPQPTFCDLQLYDAWASVRPAAEAAIRAADLVLVGSYTSQGQEIVDWLATQDRPLFFYDIDTPITLTALQHNRQLEYLRADQVPRFAVYFSFTGGPALSELEQSWGAPRAEALYCGVDPTVHAPAAVEPRFRCLLGYMGTYAADRQLKLQELLIETAELRTADRFVIAGSQYPPLRLPPNVEHLVHLYPREHAAFYCSNWVTLNLTREAMVRYGWAPSVRLFEAAACGACIISDRWPGLETLLEPNREVLLAGSRADVLGHLTSLTPERRTSIGQAARERVLREHTYERRAAQVERAYQDVVAGSKYHGGPLDSPLTRVSGGTGYAEAATKN
jgi:spore maturation protein CgeB